MRALLTQENIENILSKCYIITPPHDIISLDRPLAHPYIDGMHINATFFAGAQPSWRGDIVILAPQATDETLLHESIHARFGFGELLTYPLGKIARARTRMLERRPLLKELVLRFKGRKVKYKLCHG